MTQSRDAQRLADQATALHRDGKLDAAEQLYRQALQLQPELADGLHGLGVLALDRGLSAQAVALLGRAVRHRPQDGLYLLNLGLALRAEHHLEAARAALHVSSLRAPGDPRAHAGLASVLHQLGRHDEAETAAAAACVRADDRRLILGMRAILGQGAARSGRWTEACGLLREAVAEQPDDAASWQALGQAASALDLDDEAELCLRRLVALLPEDPAALANLGAHLFERNRHHEALDSLRQAAALGPESAETLSNLGLTLMALGHLQEAERVLSQAVRLAPGQDGILVNRGTALLELGDVDAAIRCFDTVEARSPATIDAVRARFDRATALLASGRFEQGWQAFEARRQLVAPSSHGLAEWDGQPLPGGRLLIEAEQGLGDCIQFLRFVPEAMQRADVVLSVPAALVRLAQRSLSASCLVTASDQPPPACTARAGLLSLPQLLGTFRPAWSGPYLRADATHLDPVGGIGLCWAGSDRYRFDTRRSIGLDAFAPLASSSRRFVSLQAGSAATQPAPIGMNLARPALSDELAATATLIQGLELVISVDTAIAHLAAALGRPVWLLNRSGGDWRWRHANLSPDGTSLWYPTLRVFQQPHEPESSWTATIAAVRDGLRGDRAPAG